MDPDKVNIKLPVLVILYECTDHIWLSKEHLL